jgi:hemerythrin-like domain-containing protein
MTEGTSGGADVRDMYMIHTALRRELRLGAHNARTAPDGDFQRAEVVIDHLRFVTAVLHHHHASEDRTLWPLLLERAPAEAAGLVPVMEEQHEAVSAVFAEVDVKIEEFGAAAAADDGVRLADTLDAAVGLLAKHLAVEEERALPLMERHLTREEWGRITAEGASGFDQSRMPLLLGMLMYEGDPDAVRDFAAGMPPEARPMADAAPGLYAEFALSVHGTSTPARIGAA